ncbi:MAG: Gfo/Idh/MocA family oxidoreductase [Pirellulales bacterium]|nr:Gfo/Idh/MocA family oxidoreductase [Pirellulales bacterium]
MRIRVGLVGVGEAWPRRQGPALRALIDRFEVRAICEPVGHRARQVAAEFHAQAVDGFQTLAQREDIDAVLVFSPGWFGALPIRAACAAGKAIYCGAGLELHLAEAQRIRREVEEAGVAFMAEFVRRHAPATLRLKELVATRLGEPRLVFCHQRLGADGCLNGADPAQCRHPIRKELVELVDWCCYVVGREPTHVTGLLHAGDGKSAEADYQMLSLDFSERASPGSGPLAQISCGCYIPAAWREAVSYRPLAALQVSCANGVAFVDLPSTLIWFDEAGRHQESLDSERPVDEQLLTQFHRAVTSLVRKTADLDDAFRALVIVEEAWRSAAEGQRLELPVWTAG